MNTIKSIRGLSKFISQNKEIAFVPTMGNLHDGHLALVRKARSLNKILLSYKMKMLTLFLFPIKNK